MSLGSVVQALSDADADFVIIGGWSAILNGSAYTTNDLDLCYSRASANLKRLAAALAPLHPRLRDLPPALPFVWDEVTLRHGTVFTLVTDAGQLDLLAEVAGVGAYEEVKANSVLRHAWGRDVRVLDLRSLISAKRAAGRKKDLLMIPELEALLEAQETEE
jgi:hypothetical protein